MTADAAPEPMDAASAQWLRDLRVSGVTAQRAERRLHALLLRLAYAELARRGQYAARDRDLDDLAQQAADDALVAILAKLDRFRGESRFETWAARFVLLEVTGKLRRRHVERPGRPLSAPEWDALAAHDAAGPDEHAHGRELAGAVRVAVERDLTHRQRRVFRALVYDDRPAGDVARELGCSVNAVHKAMSDARQRLRAGLALRGY